MKTYEQKLLDHLDCSGWEVVSVEKEHLDWWADEIWILSSTWSPLGSNAYLILLVDPMHEGVRKKGEAVWGVGCCKEYPSSREEAESGAVIAFGKVFKKEIDDFLLAMDDVREL